MYTLYNIPIGPTDFTASALSHLNFTRPGYIVQNGSNTLNFSLSPGGSIQPYEFTFEDGTMEGFTTETGSFWHVQYCDRTTLLNRPVDVFNSVHYIGTIEVTPKVVLPPDNNLTQNGSIPTPYQGNYYAWYGEDTLEGWPASSEGSYIGFEDPDLNNELLVDYTGGASALFISTIPPYTGNGRNSGSFISPPLDLTGYNFGQLSFWTWWEIESRNPSSGYDSMNIYVLQSPYTTWVPIGSLNPTQDPVNGASWEAYTSGGFNQPGIWVNHVFDLSAYAGKVIQIKFTFDTVDQEYNGFRAKPQEVVGKIFEMSEEDVSPHPVPEDRGQLAGKIVPWNIRALRFGAGRWSLCGRSEEQTWQK